MVLSSSALSLKATKGTITLWEKVDVAFAIATVFTNVFVASFTGLFRKPKSYFRYIACAASRSFISRASPRQQHFLLPSTDFIYSKCCKTRSVEPQSELLADGTAAHWIGKKGAKNLIINFHGGGYCLPALPSLFKLMFQIVDHLNANGKDAAVLFLAYDLAPGAPYPRQLQQASALITYVVSELGYSPSSIVITGDSAGGNLALSLLSHISHPHPSLGSITIPPVPALRSSFRGTILVSPWVSFNTSYDSFTRNYYKDLFGAKALKQWCVSFLGVKSYEDRAGAVTNYNEANSAPTSWWKTLPVKKVLLLTGEEEMLVDGIVEFGDKLSKGVSADTSVETAVIEGEYHDQASMDLGFGYTEKDEGEMAKRIKSTLLAWF